MVATGFGFSEDLIFALGMLAIFGLILLCQILWRRMWRILWWWSARSRRRIKELLERMAEDNEKMERSTEGAGHFGKVNSIPDGAFSPKSKYYLLLGNQILTISGDEFLILRGACRNVHSA
ncbi:hypothetical protein DVH24_013724 [Malus domestica]|uniref:Uncharacterized protein n=1 Tax=Malus domestica TaxID=3750 RepID=A0A498JBP0_MALDO|nr:hypothetical protein DVH24_013724 [Malus domestica]